MDGPIAVVLSWSGGKDSALALHALRADRRYRVAALLTVLAEDYGRVSHHGVRAELLERQAAALGLPLRTVWLPARAAGRGRDGGDAHDGVHDGAHASAQSDRDADRDADNDDDAMADYETAMTAALQACRAEGVRHVAYGDIFLADLRAYRERTLAALGMAGVFPLWGRPTAGLLADFVSLGFQARIVCVDGERLPAHFAGRPIDSTLAGALPPGVDPCGEHGEYHSFVSDGPGFTAPVAVALGAVVRRDRRWFADLLPADSRHDTQRVDAVHHSTDRPTDRPTRGPTHRSETPPSQGAST